jgi:outer membrane protein OmpA-like peptidoglycan-associated protein
MIKRITMATLILAALILSGCSDPYETTYSYVQAPPPKKPVDKFGYKPQHFNLAGRTIIVIPTDIIFEPNSLVFYPKAFNYLSSSLQTIQAYPNNNVHISVYTDPISGEDMNQEISAKQAAQVAGYLWSCGIQPTKYRKKLTFSGNSSHDPIATNKKIIGKAKNRRIEIIVYPNKLSFYSGKRPTEQVYDW